MTFLYLPHQEIHQGQFIIHGEHAMISEGARIDITGTIEIGDYCMIGEGTQIWTHDHYHYGREPLLIVQSRLGVIWDNKVIGRDVWLHGCIVLMQVTEIPDGVVVGAGAVLTKNPVHEYTIWAGNPAVMIGER